MIEKREEAREKVAAMSPDERNQYAAVGYNYWNIVQDDIDDSGFRGLIKASSR